MSTSRSASPRRTAEERRAEIRDAARRIALQQGLAALTLRALAHEIGIAPALVAHYTAAMEDLVAETFEDIVRAELDAVLAAAAVEASAAGRMAALLHELVRDDHLEVTAVWVDGWAMGRRSDVLAARVRSEMDRWHLALLRIVEDGRAEGAFATQDASASVHALLGMLDGVSAHALVRWGHSAARAANLLRTAERVLQAREGLLG